MNCQSCNSPLPVGSVFCPSCGQKCNNNLSTANTPQLGVPPVAQITSDFPITSTKKKFSPKVWIIVGVAIVAVLVGLFIWFSSSEGHELVGTKWITRDGEIYEFKEDYNGIWTDEYDWAYGGEQDKEFFSYSIHGDELIIYAESSRYDDGASRRVEYQYDIINDQLILSQNGRALVCYNYYKSFICDRCHAAVPNSEKHIEKSLGTICNDCWENFNEFYEKYGMTYEEYYGY